MSLQDTFVLVIHESGTSSPESKEISLRVMLSHWSGGNIALMNNNISSVNAVGLGFNVYAQQTGTNDKDDQEDLLLFSFRYNGEYYA